MKKKYTLSLHIFRRDLRLNDNTALYEALYNSDQVIPCFIIDPRQVDDKNAYKSNNALQYMIESLQDLDEQLKRYSTRLYLGYGKAEDVVEQLLKQLPIDAVFFNKDYTPFSKKRDAAIQKICEKYKRACYAFHDTLLLDPESFANKKNKPYFIFTPFYKAAVQLPVALPIINRRTNYYDKKIALLSYDSSRWLPEKNQLLLIDGGGAAAKKIIKNLEDFYDYKSTHDIPAIATTHLSAINKFGVLSIREIWHAFVNLWGTGNPLVRQLYWRDFFTHVAFHAPHVFGHAFHQKYDRLTWQNNKQDFKRWCNGTTGFPLVDAGMRELNTTGFMHNRVRMVTASFLVKDLHIDWRWGEQYFAQKLIDYDPAVNNGNWQWCASTGCDAQPYFRILNPWLQQKKFDPQAEYIKQWIPELRPYNAKEIHLHVKQPLAGYPEPMVDHAAARIVALKSYKKFKERL